LIIFRVKAVVDAACGQVDWTAGTARLGLTCCLLLVMVGCKPRETQSHREQDPVSGERESAADAPTAVSAADVMPDGTSAFSHPIDQIPEGMQFRAATRALDLGDFETAERILAELSRGQFRPLATAIEAITFIKRGQLGAALALAEDLSELEVMQAESYVIAGEVFQIQNRLSEASAAFANALALNPEHVRAHLWIGTIYYDTGAMRLATEHLRRAAELEPREVNALLLSGKIHQDYEQYDDAIADYRRALERIEDKSKRLTVEVRLAECLVETRRAEEATVVLEGAPEVPAVLVCRAMIAESAGDFATAAGLAKRVLKMNADNRPAALVLGRVRLTEQAWPEAIEVLKLVVEAAPFDHEPRMLFGRALVGAGERDRGEAEIQRATELKEAFLKFADLHQEAIRLPNDAALRVQLGKLAEQLGKYELARSWYRAALGLEPDLVEAAQSLERLQP
jgi:tetratricopeptide (TPR) repeat protein